MAASKILHTHLNSALEKMDPRRAKNIIRGILSILRSNGGSFSHIARHSNKDIAEKHQVKWYQHLINNRHVYRALMHLQRAHARAIIGIETAPLLLIDWTDLTSDFTLLSATMACDGRSIPIYQEVHKKGVGNRTKTHIAFLDRFEEVLPDRCMPIIVTDAGFKNKWFAAVISRNWDVVGRLAKYVYITPKGVKDGKSTLGTYPRLAETLYDRATETPTSLGPCIVTKKSPIEFTVVLYKSQRKGRKAYYNPKTHRGNSSNASMKAKKRANDPWILATSLSELKPQAVVDLYAARMQCEETFRDLKSHRFGLSMEDLRCDSKARLSVHLFLMMMAVYFSMRLGAAAERLDLQKEFQANTIKHRRVLSRVSLGRRIFSKFDQFWPRIKHIFFDPLKPHSFPPKPNTLVLSTA